MTIEPDDLKAADAELHNWGRFAFDGFLRDHLLYTNPPTSEQYRAPVVVYDEPEPIRHPVDEQLALATEHIVVHIGVSNFDHHQALVAWYTRIMRVPIYSADNGTETAIRKLARRMHTNDDGARQLLDESKYLYWLHRELQRFTRSRKFAKVGRGILCPR